MRWMSVVRGAGVIAAVAVTAQVAQGQVVGTANAAGSASLTKAPGVGQPVTITFTGPTIAVPTLDGIFAPIAPGTTGTIQNITVGTGAFNVPNFFQIGGYTLSLTNVAAGTFSSTSCFDPAAAGQTCTLPGTPFNLVNVDNGHGGLNSSLGFQFSGLVTAPSSTTYDYTANFTAQYTSAYQQNTNTMDSGGSVPTSYSLTIQATVPQTVTTTPEPTTFAMLGSGLLGLVGVVRVRRRA